MITPRPNGPSGRDRAEDALRAFRVQSLEGFGCGALGLSLSAAGATLRTSGRPRKYPSATSAASPARAPRTASCSTARPSSAWNYAHPPRGARKGSLLWVLDRTLTPMGGRLLKEWLVGPLRRIEDITARQDSVEELSGIARCAGDPRRLKEVYDIERLTARVATGRANARDLLALRRSLEPLPALKERLSSAGTARLRARRAAGHGRGSARARRRRRRARPAGAPQRRRPHPRRYSAELDELRSIQRDGKRGSPGSRRARSSGRKSPPSGTGITRSSATTSR